MVVCPISYWKTHRSSAPALAGCTYQELDDLVRRLSTSLASLHSSIIAFIPKRTPLDCALFFAAWRLQKSVYPLSHRLPMGEIKKRLQFTGAHLVETVLSDKASEENTLEPNQFATLLETSSGTKIACHTMQAHLVGAKEAIQALNIDQTSTYCLNLPLFHISGLATMLRTFLAGGHLVFEPTEATHLSMVPTQVWRLKQPLSKCKCLLVGGAPFSQQEYQRKLLEGYPLFLTYGMTETSSMIAVKPPYQKTKILPHIDLKMGKDSEIFVKGPSLFHGYFGQKKHSGWFATKDLGLWKDGELTILGRKDRQFISGGENICPEEIEEALREIEGIMEARVIPQDDLEFGQVPYARICLNKAVDLDQVKKLLEIRLPRFKIPKNIEIVDLQSLHLKMRDEPIGQFY